MNPALTASALLLTMSIQETSEQTIFDFQSKPPMARWQIVNDDVMGGVSTSSFHLTEGAAIFRGRVSFENNGGFASVRTLPPPLDLTGCDTFVIRVRGDGKRYKFTARMQPNLDSAIYQFAFTTRAGQWEEHRLPFQQFVPSYRGRTLQGQPPLDPAKIQSLGFLISDRQEGSFRLEIAWIRAMGSTDNPAGIPQR
jgi:NADH dehydrogenase [ubiquinone] 1 alpha subcomplex assembly factor 1